MDPYLLHVARGMQGLQSREAIERVLDELEFLYEAVDDQQQGIIEELLARLRARLAELP
jgi:hypothetical protein